MRSLAHVVIVDQDEVAELEVTGKGTFRQLSQSNNYGQGSVPSKGSSLRRDTLLEASITAESIAVRIP